MGTLALGCNLSLLTCHNYGIILQLIGKKKRQMLVNVEPGIQSDCDFTANNTECHRTRSNKQIYNICQFILLILATSRLSAHQWVPTQDYWKLSSRVF
jgi:hypothetical protein